MLNKCLIAALVSSAMFVINGCGDSDDGHETGVYEPSHCGIELPPCTSDNNCFISSCADSVCDRGTCVHSPRASTLRCIEWSAEQNTHIGGFCGDCRCVETPVTHPAADPSSSQ